MKNIIFSICTILIFLGVVVLCFLPLTPSVPSSLSVTQVTAGQEEFATLFELGLRYEQQGLLDEAQSAYADASKAEQSELTQAALSGLERVLQRKQSFWLRMQTIGLQFLNWLAQNVLKLLILIGVVWLGSRLLKYIPRQPGYLLLPFDDQTEQCLGKGAHALVYLTLQQAKRVHAEANKVLLSRSDKLEIPLFAAMPSALSALSTTLSSIDAFSVGGIELPLGKLFLTAFQWFSTREQVITCIVMKKDSRLQLLAEIRNAATDEVIQTWDLVASDDNLSDAAQLADLTDALAFRILSQVGKGLESHSWRSLQFLTRGLNEIHPNNGEGIDHARYERAAKLFTEALTLAPNLLPARYQLGIVYSHLGRNKEARDEFRKAIIGTSPNALRATYNIGLAFYHEFQDWAFIKAIEQFEIVFNALQSQELADDDKLLLALTCCGLANAHAQRMKSVAHHHTGADLTISSAQVQKYCEQAQNLTRTNMNLDIQVATANALGVMYQSQDHFEDAINSFQSAIGVNPSYDAAYINLADAYAASNLQEAIQWLEQGLHWHPDHQYAYFRLGKLLTQQGQMAEAKAAYRKALDIPDACNSLGEILAQEKEYREALQAFHKAARLNKRQARFWRNLAYWTVHSGEREETKLQQATEWARRALELDKDTTYAWLNLDVLGWVLLHRERVDEAEQAFLRSKNSPPGDKKIQNRYHLAYLYQHIGALDKARSELIIALQFHERGEWRDKAIELMKKLPHK